ncbi:hypothetical protein MMJ63_27455, partial [Bacillus vallismortis]|nr:hypothetical protein [Bacillus vallismortis]
RLDISWLMLSVGAEWICSMLTHLHQLFYAQSVLMQQHLTSMNSKTAFLADEYHKVMKGVHLYCQTLQQLFFDSDDDEA